MRLFIRYLTSIILFVTAILVPVELILYAATTEPYNWTPLYIFAIALVVNRLTFNK